MLRAKTATGASQSAGGSLRLAPLVFVRLGELRRAEWRIPAEKRKMREFHILPALSFPAWLNYVCRDVVSRNGSWP